MTKDTTSLSPGSPVEIGKTGIKFRITWKHIMSGIGILLGSGILAGGATLFNVGSSVADDFSSFKKDQRVVHQDIDKTLKAQDVRAVAQDARISDISKVVTSVQTTQQRDVARTEARRLTEKIPNRSEREEAYDRLYELNLKHLQRGEDPCGTVNCN
jgi:hypothetical protein